MTINLELLKEYIERSGLKQKYISDALGITYVAFHSKMKGVTEFTLKEFLQLKKLLGLTDEEHAALINEII